MKKIGLVLILIVQMCLLLTTAGYGSGKTAQIKLPDSLSPGLLHLLDLVDPQQSERFDSERIAEILEFIDAPKDLNSLYYPDTNTGVPSAYYEFDVARGLQDVLKYAFNPDIPGHITMPSSIRLSHWRQVDGHVQTLPKLWKQIDTLDSPVVISGIEVMENTPDTFSGAYYKYDLHRTLILFKADNRKVLMSISKQTDVSHVGQKGYVLGADKNWDYFYTGKPGLTITGLGWVRSYMYDSYGISVYYEREPGAPMVRCAIFKWLRAGWSRINMVKRFHIYEGLLRFAKSYKEIMESAQLPGADTLADFYSGIRALGIDDLRDKIALYPHILKSRYSISPPPDAKWSSDLFHNREYWASLSKEEMQSLIMLEYMKAALGKTSKEEVAGLLSN
jgi:hypothetical protein